MHAEFNSHGKHVDGVKKVDLEEFHQNLLGIVETILNFCGGNTVECNNWWLSHRDNVHSWVKPELRQIKMSYLQYFTQWKNEMEFFGKMLEGHKIDGIGKEEYLNFEGFDKFLAEHIPSAESSKFGQNLNASKAKHLETAAEIFVHVFVGDKVTTKNAITEHYECVVRIFGIVFMFDNDGIWLVNEEYYPKLHENALKMRNHKFHQKKPITPVAVQNALDRLNAEQFAAGTFDNVKNSSKTFVRTFVEALLGGKKMENKWPVELRESVKKA